MAYVYEGQKWNGDPFGSPGGNLTWSIDATIPASFENDLAQAFTWSDFGNITFTQVALGAPSDITFTYGALPGSTVGRADYTFNPANNEILSSTIIIDNTETWTEDANGVATLPGGARLSTVALHEVGHSIGLDHIDPAVEVAIMNPILTAETTTLQPSDIEGVQAIYGVVCFLTGTLIRTARGEVPVEDLVIGDTVLTADGDTRPVTWIGRQSVVAAFADPVRSYPIRIQAGALSEGVPARDLFLSPDHALLIDGVLVQAGALVNGATVTRVMNPEAHFSYYHVETEDHAIILAEGTPAETFVSNVTRRTFDNYAEYEALFGARADFEAMADRDEPRAMSARQVPVRIKARLSARAASLMPELSAAA